MDYRLLARAVLAFSFFFCGYFLTDEDGHIRFLVNCLFGLLFGFFLTSTKI